MLKSVKINDSIRDRTGNELSMVELHYKELSITDWIIRWNFREKIMGGSAPRNLSTLLASPYFLAVSYRSILLFVNLGDTMLDSF